MDMSAAEGEKGKDSASRLTEWGGRVKVAILVLWSVSWLSESSAMEEMLEEDLPCFCCGCTRGISLRAVSNKSTADNKRHTICLDRWIPPQSKGLDSHS